MLANRRQFLTAAGAIAGTSFVAGTLSPLLASEKKGAGIKYGLVTYQWAKDWDLPTLLANMQKTGVLGVELRTTHKHGVEPTLTKEERADVRKLFADAGLTCVGIGSNERFDDPNPDVVNKAIEATKAFIELSHDIGGSGVKVKPDRFHDGVDKKKTIEQIGKSLNDVAEYATGFGQQIRLEVHGQCAQLPTIKAIMDVATNPNVAVCWNSNPQDLEEPGLEHNFELVKDRFGETCHIHRMEQKDYPHQKLIDLYVGIDWQGWMMLEEGKIPEDIVGELAREREMFETMLDDSRRRAG